MKPVSLIRGQLLNLFSARQQRGLFNFLDDGSRAVFGNVFFSNKNEVKQNVESCGVRVTSVACLHHKGLDFRVIVLRQTVVIFSSTSLLRGYFELTTARELRDYETYHRRAQNLKFEQ
jgi:hypothetical protein